VFTRDEILAGIIESLRGVGYRLAESSEEP
jgi:hypothetical protein